MAHWFHRNPLKSSKTQNFDALKLIAKTPPASKLCGELRVSRARLLQQLADARNTMETVEKSVNEYLALIQGLCEDVVPSKPEEGEETSRHAEGKLRKIEVFKWTNTICGNVATALPDAYYEMISILTEFALWHTKRASYVASNESLGEEDAKEVFKHLRMAAGIFIQAKNLSESKLGTGLVEKHGDTDGRILDAYHLQSLAEAQEVTVARAVELKHKPATITAVAVGTSELFQKADDSLRSVEKAAKWRKYLQIKKNIYLAYAYENLGQLHIPRKSSTQAHSFKGEALLSEDKCGEAIKSLQEAEKCYSMAGMLCKQYASSKGPGTSAKPDHHQFYLRLGPIVRTKLEKANHENGFIYHQKVPAEVPELETTEVGIASPIEFVIPSVSPKWKPEIFAAFDAGKAKPQMDGKNDQEKLEPVKEVEDPNNKGNNRETGCVIS